ncbi:MAG: tetratricopeptide repeat protein [Bacteroidales bacterium]|jgi:tetratricopeptide (TPR) repeat protein
MLTNRIQWIFYQCVLLILLLIPLSALIAQPAGAIDLEQDFYSKIIKTHPGNADSILLHSEAFIQQALRLKNEETLSLLLKASILLTEHYYVESAGKCLRVGLQLSKSTRNEEKELEFYMAFTDMFYRNMQNDSARYYSDQAYKISQKENFSKFNSQIFNDKARIAEVSGNRLQAIDWYLKDVELLKNNHDTARLAVVLNNIAILHINMESYDQAIGYILESIKLNELLANEDALCNSYIDLAISYQENSNLQQAVIYYNKAIILSKKTNNDYQQARVFMNLANSKLMLGKFKESQAYLDSSTKLCVLNNMDAGLLFNKINQGELYLATAQNSKGLKQLQEAEIHNNSYNLPTITVELWRLLSEAYERNKDYPRALDYYKKHVTLFDSISGAETKRVILELQMRYNEEHTARQLETLQQSFDKQKTQIWYTIIGLVFSISIIFLLVALNYVSRRSANYKNRLAIEETEKLRLQMEMKDQELVSKAMNMSKINQMVLDVGNELKKLLPGLTKEKTDAFQHLLQNLESSLPSEAWKEFETRFEQVHKSFYDKLTALHPDLSPTEIKICGFLRLNLTTKDIAVLTNRSVGTIDNARSAIRKKMNLENDSNLTNFLLSL